MCSRHRKWGVQTQEVRGSDTGGEGFQTQKVMGSRHRKWWVQTQEVMGSRQRKWGHTDTGRNWSKHLYFWSDVRCISCAFRVVASVFESSYFQLHTDLFRLRNINMFQKGGVCHMCHPASSKHSVSNKTILRLTVLTSSLHTHIMHSEATFLCSTHPVPCIKMRRGIYCTQTLCKSFLPLFILQLYTFFNVTQLEI